jgi:hypothetical protein
MRAPTLVAITRRWASATSSRASNGYKVAVVAKLTENGAKGRVGRAAIAGRV